MTPKSMRAAVLNTFGGPEQINLAQRPVPRIGPSQVLVRNIATSVNSGDARIRAKNVPRGYGFLMSLVFGFSNPRKEVLGTVFAGEIVDVGANVKEFKCGDRVFGSTELKMATHAEFIAIKESQAILHQPEGFSAAESTSVVFGGMTAMFFSAAVDLKKGERILINAAAGSVGIALVQLASAKGAHVTAIASTRNHAFLIENGAHEVIDYTIADLAKLPSRFDVIADCLGTMPYRNHRHLLNRSGRVAQITGTLAEAYAAPIRNLFGPNKIVGGTSLATKTGLRELSDLIKAGHIRPVIDREYPFEQIRDAHAYVDTGHKRGNVVVTF